MASKNLKKLTALSIAYNVPFQPLYTKEALEKGNTECVHKALIGGKEYTCLQQYNHERLENLFKTVACGDDNMHASANTVIFNQKSDVISINGNRYTIFDIIKDVEFGTLNDMIGNYISHGEEWQIETAMKIKEWFKNGGFIQWLEYQYQKEYGETVDEYMARVEDEEGMRV
jgi:hypothetical protein